MRLELLRPAWQRYGFAVLVSVLASLAPHGYGNAPGMQKMPFVAALTAVIATAAIAGFGPTFLAIVLGGAWSIAELLREPRFTPADIITRLLIFGIEGMLVALYAWAARRIARHIAKASDWHRRLLETSSEGIWVLNSDGAISYANPRLAEILGTTVEAIQGKPSEEFFFGSDLAAERIRSQNLSAGQKEQFDRRLRRADGGEVWVLTCANPVFDEQQQLQGLLSMMTDITERKRAEYALRRSEDKFRSLFDNIQQGVYQSTPAGRILAANPMLLKMLGLTSQAQFNSVSIAEDLYIDKEVRKHLLERLEQDGTFQNVEYQLRRHDGRIITVRENARIVRDEDGNILYYEGTLADITERHSLSV